MFAASHRLTLKAKVLCAVPPPALPVVSEANKTAFLRRRKIKPSPQKRPYPRTIGFFKPSRIFSFALKSAEQNLKTPFSIRRENALFYERAFKEESPSSRSARHSAAAPIRKSDFQLQTLCARLGKKPKTPRPAGGQIAQTLYVWPLKNLLFKTASFSLIPCPSSMRLPSALKRRVILSKTPFGPLC